MLVALLKPADLYILDEPLANVDADSRASVMEMILTETGGAAVLAILHGDDEHHAAFDRTVTLRPRPNPLGDGAAVSVPVLSAV